MEANELLLNIEELIFRQSNSASDLRLTHYYNSIKFVIIQEKLKNHLNFLRKIEFSVKPE